MVEKQSGTGQWRKLVFNKKYSDQQGVIWKLSAWKVAMWLIAIIVVLIAAFSFFQEDQGDFLRNVLFYSIITMILILIVWIATAFVWKARKIFYRFLIGWILLLGVYLVLGFVCQASGLYPNGFHYGFSTWVLLSTLALGARNVGDGSVDRKDVFYTMLVVIVFFVGNAPIFSGGIGFLEQVDILLALIAEKLSFINPESLIAE